MEPLPEAQQEVERNYKHNFTVNALDGAIYWFGYSFMAPAIILPLYLKHFTDNPLIFGLIPFLNTAGFLLPQLFTSNAVERAPRKKIFPVNYGFFTERLPVLLFPVSAALFAADQPFVALALFLLLYSWYSGGAGLIIVGWQDMIAKIIPVDRRGRFFGTTQFLGNITGFAGTLAVPVILSRFDFPTGFVILFTAAAALVLTSWFFLALTREPAVANPKPAVSQAAYLRTLPRVVRSDPNFLRYLIFFTVFSLGGMGSGFLIVYSAQQWNLSDSYGSVFASTMVFGQILSNIVIGFLSDRRGHKVVLEAGALLSGLSFLLAFLAQSPLWFYPIFILRGMVFAVINISAITIVMEFTSPENRPTYFGLANTVPGIASSLAPLLGGWLAHAAGYPPIFALSAVLSFASLALLRWMVRDPRDARRAAGPAARVETSAEDESKPKEAA
jgi:MFS family permease